MALEMSKIRAMSPEDLNREEAGLREEIWKLRLQRSVGQAATPHKIQRVRHDLARILTLRRERELAAAGRSGRRR
jgi:large subunit ribosomal protein L29